MTSSPSDLALFRTRQVIPKTGLVGVEVGIAPDPAHLSTGGYHVGCEDIQRIGRWNRDYSTRQARDRLDGTNLASAMDIGDNWPRGGRAAWLRFNNLLVARMRAGDPALAALRAVNFSPDGTARKRYDSLHAGAGIIDSTDSVYMHTHLEWWRNTAGTAARAGSLHRIGQIIDAAIAGVALSPEENDMDLNDELLIPRYEEYPGLPEVERTTVGDALKSAMRRSFLAMRHSQDIAATLKGMALQDEARALADEARDRAMQAAIDGLVAAVQAGGGTIDAAPIVAAVHEVRDEARAKFVQLETENADLREQLARAVAAAEANLSPAERDALPAV